MICSLRCHREGAPEVHGVCEKTAATTTTTDDGTQPIEGDDADDGVDIAVTAKEKLRSALHSIDIPVTVFEVDFQSSVANKAHE